MVVHGTIGVVSDQTLRLNETRAASSRMTNDGRRTTTVAASGSPRQVFIKKKGNPMRKKFAHRGLAAPSSLLVLSIALPAAAQDPGSQPDAAEDLDEIIVTGIIG